LNSATFFNLVRLSVFEGKLSASQVEGLELIIAEGNRRHINNEFLAYVLATAAWETAYTMQPITEYGSQKYLRGKKYWPYIGRGFVQLTWRDNYEKAGRILGVDLVGNPDLAKRPDIAVRILFDGMILGWFTGKGLDDFLDGKDESDKEDLREFSNARRIVNGTDKQVAIGKLAISFEKALRASRRAEGGDPVQSTPEPAPAAPEAPVAPTEAPKEGLLVRILRLLIKILSP
jgi:hypothetical protein